MTHELREYDPAEFLDSEEAMEGYLNATCEDGDDSEIAAALCTVARARGVADLAARVGIGETDLQKAATGETKPDFALLSKMAGALGFRLSFAKATPHDRTAA
jgi:probable addiction module antidote protein